MAFALDPATLKATTAVGILAEVATLIQAQEISYNAANPTATALDRMNISYEADDQELTIEIALPVALSVDSTGKVLLTPTDYFV